MSDFNNGCNILANTMQLGMRCGLWVLAPYLTYAGISGYAKGFFRVCECVSNFDVLSELEKKKKALSRE